jgi:putative FmdB family regulatory protein
VPAHARGAAEQRTWRGGWLMPYYDYHCSKCNKQFTVKMSFDEYGKKEVKCPDCGSKKVERVYVAVAAKTSKKS